MEAHNPTPEVDTGGAGAKGDSRLTIGLQPLGDHPGLFQTSFVVVIVFPLPPPPLGPFLRILATVIRKKKKKKIKKIIPPVKNVFNFF